MPESKRMSIEDVMTKEGKAWSNFVERLKFYIETLNLGDKEVQKEAAKKMKDMMEAYVTLHQQRIKINTKKINKKEGKSS